MRCLLVHSSYILIFRQFTHRYFDPVIGRFINADAYASTGQGILGNNMFAYCLNNAVAFMDDTGSVAKSCLSPEGQIDDTPWRDHSPGGGGGVNYHSSSPYDKKYGLINGQKLFEFANSRCGIGTYGKNGCAIIAVYNAMQLLGQPQSLGSVENEFMNKHGMLLFGAWGVAPWSFDNYFDAHGIANAGYFSYNAMMQDISEGSIVVFTIMNDKHNIFKGFHTMTAQYVGGRFVVYNRYSGSASVQYSNSLLNLNSGGCWIYGYIIGG